MKITKLIEKLELIKSKNGDLEVMIMHFDGVEEFQTTVENFFVENYKFIRGREEKIVKLTL